MNTKEKDPKDAKVPLDHSGDDDNPKDADVKNGIGDAGDEGTDRAKRDLVDDEQKTEDAEKKPESEEKPEEKSEEDSEKPVEEEKDVAGVHGGQSPLEMIDSQFRMKHMRGF